MQVLEGKKRRERQLQRLRVKKDYAAWRERLPKLLFKASAPVLLYKVSTRQPVAVVDVWRGKPVLKLKRLPFAVLRHQRRPVMLKRQP